MRIIIDADSCPSIKLIEKMAIDYHLECHFFFDNTHQIESEYSIRHILDKESQSVDMAIINFVLENDIVITNDYGLAALTLNKCYAIHSNGFIYTNENINNLLNARYFSAKMRKSNQRIKGPRKRTAEDDKNLLNSLKSVIEISLNKHKSM